MTTIKEDKIKRAELLLTKLHEQLTEGSRLKESIRNNDELSPDEIAQGIKRYTQARKLALKIGLELPAEFQSYYRCFVYYGLCPCEYSDRHSGRYSLDELGYELMFKSVYNIVPGSMWERTDQA